MWCLHLRAVCVGCAIYRKFMREVLGQHGNSCGSIVGFIPLHSVIPGHSSRTKLKKFVIPLILRYSLALISGGVQRNPETMAFLDPECSKCLFGPTRDFSAQVSACKWEISGFAIFPNHLSGFTLNLAYK